MDTISITISRGVLKQFERIASELEMETEKLIRLELENSAWRWKKVLEIKKRGFESQSAGDHQS